MQIERAYLSLGNPITFWPVACGNGEVRLIHEDGSSPKLCDGYVAGWSEDGSEIAVSRDVPGGRSLTWVNWRTGAERPSGIPEWQQPGYFPQIAARNGRIVSSIDGQHFVDGQPIPTEAGAGKIEHFDGVCILYPRIDSGGAYSFLVRDIVTGKIVLTVPFYIMNGRLDRLSDGSWLSATGPVCWSPTGTRYDGAVGEDRGLMTEYNGQTIIVTGRVDGNPIWLFRLLEERRKEDPAWRLDNIGLQFMSLQHGMCIGSVQARQGVGTILPVPYDSPRAVYVVPTAPPVPVPGPITPQPTPTPVPIPPVVPTPPPTPVPSEPTPVPPPPAPPSTPPRVSRSAVYRIVRRILGFFVAR